MKQVRLISTGTKNILLNEIHQIRGQIEVGHFVNVYSPVVGQTMPK